MKSIRVFIGYTTEIKLAIGAFLVTLLLLLFGSHDTAGACGMRPIVVQTPLVNYSDDFERKAAIELNQIVKKYPHIVQMIIDYGQLRAAERVK